MLKNLWPGEIFPKKVALVLLLAFVIVTTGCVEITQRNETGCIERITWFGSIDCYNMPIANGGRVECHFPTEGTYKWYSPASACCPAGSGTGSVHDGAVFMLDCRNDQLQLIPEERAQGDEGCSTIVVAAVVDQ